MIGKDKVLTVLKGVLDRSPAEQTEAVFIGTSSGLTRYANSYIHQNVYESSTKIYFRTAVGQKLGVASTSSLEKEDLNRTLLSAYNIALNQLDNPDFDKFPGKTKYQKLKTHYPGTAKFTPTQRADKVKILFKLAAKKKLSVAGSFATSESEIAVMNSNGVVAYQPVTSGTMNVIMTGDDSSGYADSASRDVRTLNFKELGETAFQKCLESANPQDIPPGKYNVILEPTAVTEILEWMNYTGFGAKNYEDGSSFLSGRIGKKIMGENVTIYDDALDETGMAFPFDFEGVPKKKVYFIKKGVGGGIVHDNLSANRARTKSTGHALTPDNSDGAFSLNTFVAGGRNSRNSMISNTEKGILVTRFHYINGLLDTNKALMTGMTRDGTFFIKKGKIQYGIKNLRFTESMLKAFSRIKMISKERKPVAAWWSDIGCVVAPTILISGFNFSGKTDF
ncbi:MAG: TldD/PmbA family protein [candidate division Zixibacteria bacterium]|nr:TldD/PmbA family protein [candidate division Zixibacteria bacterium]